jgi:hypothetical protein
MYLSSDFYYIIYIYIKIELKTSKVLIITFKN